MQTRSLVFLRQQRHMDSSTVTKTPTSTCFNTVCFSIAEILSSSNLMLRLKAVNSVLLTRVQPAFKVKACLPM